MMLSDSGLLFGGNPVRCSCSHIQISATQ